MLEDEAGLRPLTVGIATGFGEGATTLSAYDRALYEAGIGDYNLLYLSSVIPPNTRLVEKQHDAPADQWGHRLYVVVAEQRTSVSGDGAWAGIGWIQDPRTGAGLFVEHHGTTEEAVVDEIHHSLGDMRSYRPDNFGPVGMVVRGGVCTDRPVCALVAAVYGARSWEPMRDAA